MATTSVRSYSEDKAKIEMAEVWLGPTLANLQPVTRLILWGRAAPARARARVQCGGAVAAAVVAALVAGLVAGLL